MEAMKTYRPTLADLLLFYSREVQKQIEMWGYTEKSVVITVVDSYDKEY